MALRASFVRPAGQEPAQIIPGLNLGKFSCCLMVYSPAMEVTREERQQMNKPEQLRTEAAQHDQDAENSFQRCDTDGFLSQWASGINAQRKRLEADLEEAGGIATFAALTLTDLDGNPVKAKTITGRYGLCHALLNPAGGFTGEFVTARPKRKATMTRKGYVEQEVVFVDSAIVVTRGASTTSVHAVVVPKSPEVPFYRVVGLGDQRSLSLRQREADQS